MNGVNDLQSREENLEKLEIILIERAKCLCNLQKSDEKCKCFSTENLFILAQFYFDTNRIRKAFHIFDTIKHEHKPSMYQLACILYDDMLDSEESTQSLIYSDTDSSQGDETQASFFSGKQDKSSSARGFTYMLKLAQCEKYEENETCMIHSAQYNVGLAYFQGILFVIYTHKWLKSYIYYEQEYKLFSIQFFIASI